MKIIYDEEYRDLWIAEGILKEEYVGCYTREYYCLDNFSSFDVAYNGEVYNTAEHAYQAQKFEPGSLVRMRIKNSGSAHDAKLIAREFDNEKRGDWDDMKLTEMESILRCKLAQHEYVRKKLLRSGDRLIVEDSPIDSFWGIGPNRDGENHLGKMWMKLREEVKNSKSVGNGPATVSNPGNKVDDDGGVSLEDLITQAFVDGGPDSWFAMRDYLDEMKEDSEEDLDELKNAIRDYTLDELYRTLYYTYESRLSPEEYDKYKREYRTSFDFDDEDVFPDK